jgi:hypothetical protein
MNGPPNKRMQLTKLRAAPVRQAEVPPCAPAGETDGGTASQLIRGVRRTGTGEPELVTGDTEPALKFSGNSSGKEVYPKAG